MNDTAVQALSKADAGLRWNEDINSASLFYMTKGFSRIFWGLLLNMMLFFGQASLELFHYIRIPAYVIGAAVVVWGLFSLYDAGRISKTWRRRVRLTIVLVLLEIYFAPFAEWWKNMPDMMFYLINCFGLLLTSMLILLAVNILAAEVSRYLNDRSGQIESYLFAFGIILFMILPLIISMVFCSIAAFRYDTSFYVEVWCVINRMPPWVSFFIIIPCSLTLIALWKAKDLCYRTLCAIE